MRRTALTVIGAGVVALTGQMASAADMPARPVYKAAPMVAAAPTWTGCYIGGHAGFGWSRWRDRELPDFISSPDASIPDEQLIFGFSGRFRTDGFIGGGQFGCDMQLGTWLLGAVLDASWTHQRRNSDPFQIQTLVPEGPNAAETARVELKYLGTARGRLGFISGPWLFYGTGGLAWARARYSITGAVASDATTYPLNVSDTSDFLGWAAGLGFDWMFRPGWTLGVEYLHLGFGNANFRFGNVFPDKESGIALGGGTSLRLSSDVVRGTVNFRF